MARTVRDVLLTALEDLGDEGLKKFCAKIRDFEIKEGYTKITKRKVENAKPLDVVEVILSYYTASYGPELTVEVLDAIDEKNVALALKKALEEVKGFTWEKKPKEEPPSTSGASSSSVPKPQEKHFVDKYEEDLIARVALVEPILDGLKSKELLIDQQYDTIRKERTPQGKMRELYVHIRGFSKSDKDTLYEILKKYNGPLVKDLEDP